MCLGGLDGEPRLRHLSTLAMTPTPPRNANAGPVRIAPSILSADFGRLSDEVRAVEAAGADWVHVDIMDGRFVPNITIGPVVVKAIRRATKLPLDVHLMIADPDLYLDAFAQAGADVLTVHVEACTHLHRTLQHIHHLGKRAGVVMNPATHESTLRYVMAEVDLVLVMSVNPGFGGQAFIPEVLPKVRAIREMIDESRRNIDLEIDGGLSPETVASATAHGARVIVAGTAVFGHGELRHGDRGLASRGRARGRALVTKAPGFAFVLFIAACGSSASRAVTAPVLGSAATPSASATATPEAGPKAATDAGTAEPREMRLIARMLKRVERARGLGSTKPVPGVVLDRAALIAQVKSHVSRDLPPEAIHDEGLTLQLLGFVPTEFDYEAAEYSLLQDQLAGYYEPSDGTMYMASDLGEDEAAATLAHELVHARQDQQWNLEARSKYRPGEGDRSEAVSALAEGDATSAMFDVMIAREAPGTNKTVLDLPAEAFTEQIREGMDQGPASTAPHVMRSSLAAPYIYGTSFVNALRRRGGWEAVNRAWAQPPATSEQIMHLDKWLAREPPLLVAAPTFATLGSGWSVADEDSEGELGTRVAFEEWVDATRAANASAGWGGDRGVLVARGDRAAFAWRIRYDATSAKQPLAVAAYDAVALGIDHSAGAPSTHDATFDCRERPDRGPLAVARLGTDLVVVAGPARTHAGGAWTSAGSCADARKWVKEIGSR